MNDQTTNIDLFSLFTVSREEAKRSGGVFAETLNIIEDGVAYIPLNTAEIVNQTFSNQPSGEQQ